MEAEEPKVQIDGLALDPETYEVTWKDSCIRLTPTEFRILYLLATNAGHVVPSSRLYTYVWGSEGADANALRSHMSHLRRKLETLNDCPGTIGAVPAVGYAFKRATAPAPAAAAQPRPLAPVVTLRTHAPEAPRPLAPAAMAPSTVAPAEGSIA